MVVPGMVVPSMVVPRTGQPNRSARSGVGSPNPSPAEKGHWGEWPPGPHLPTDRVHAEQVAAVLVDRRHDAVRRATSQPVIGVLGNDLPRAVIDAAGGTPYYLVPSGTAPSPEAERLLGAASGPPVRQLLSDILAGELDFLSALVITRESQALIEIFYVLRMLSAAGRLAFPVHFVELLHSERSATVAYNRHQLERLEERLSDWVGPSARVQPLAATVTRQRHLQRRVCELRSDHRMLGSAWVALLSHLSALPLAEAEAAVPAAADSGPVPDLRPVVLTGTRQWTPTLYRMLEASGINVVDDDHAGGRLAVAFDFDDDLTDALGAVAWAVSRWGPAAATSSQRARAAQLRRLVAGSRAEAVLAVIEPHDAAAGWDLPAQRDVCVELGRPLAQYRWSGQDLTMEVAS